MNTDNNTRYAINASARNNGTAYFSYSPDASTRAYHDGHQHAAAAAYNTPPNHQRQQRPFPSKHNSKHQQSSAPYPSYAHPQQNQSATSTPMPPSPNSSSNSASPSFSHTAAQLLLSANPNFITNASCASNSSNGYVSSNSSNSGGESPRALSYSFNPYGTDSCVVFHMPQSMLPSGTLHLKLEGNVTFFPYPTEPFVAEPASVPKDQMTRVFIGQLPYQVTDMQLQWLCAAFGGGGCVYYPERIMKRDEQRGGKVPTGCIHAYCDPAIMDDLATGMHKRLLVDDTGVWYAQTAEEAQFLNSYCQTLKLDKRLRFQNRPYDSVVVQVAVSSYPIGPQGSHTSSAAHYSGSSKYQSYHGSQKG